MLKSGLAGVLPALQVSWLGRRDYEPTWQAMQALTQTRDAATPDQLWLLDHPPVYTQGQAGKPEHLLLTGDIPVVQSDRGGQVTYHGPGQLVGYLLIDIDRLSLSTRAFVEAVEDALAAAVRSFGINAVANRDAHGVYVDGRKIASIGMRIRRGCSYHGFSLNVDMDLAPFRGINPCGYAGLDMCQLRDFVPNRVSLMSEARAAVIGGLQQYLPQLDLGLSSRA
ncbi:MAG: lipoyl(octanoyl) transferase LipB [Pseudomonadota bacterium]